MKATNSTNYVCQSTLLKRGWTKAMIKEYGLEPDKEVRNPHYRCSGDMKLYLLDKIEAIEADAWFKTRYAKSLKRRESAREAANRVAQRKFQETMDYVDSIQIELPDWKKEKVFKKAIEHYNDLWTYRGKYDKYIYDWQYLDDETLERLTTNYFRHGYFDYDEVLDSLFGEVGVSFAHTVLKERINTAVHDKYFNNQPNEVVC